MRFWNPGFAALAVIASPSAAQVVQPDPKPVESDRLEDIVVTARKTAESLQDVPISVNVQTGADLLRSRVRSLEDISELVPNVLVQRSPGNAQIYMRGVGSASGNLGFEQSVGVFVDGIYNGRARQNATPFLDIERVEVLRGPQGSLFGKNTSAGAINIITKGPTDTFEGSIAADYTFEGDNGPSLTGIASGPIADGVGIRVVVSHTRANGYLDNLTRGRTEPRRDNLLGRATIEFRPVAGLSIRLKGEAARFNLDGQPFETRTGGDYRLRGDRSTTLGVPDFDDSKSRLAALNVAYELSPAITLTAISGYSWYTYDKFIDSDFTVAPSSLSEFAETFHQLSQEFRISGATGPVQYVVGAYLHHNAYDLKQVSILTAGSSNGTSTRLFHQDEDTTSLYGQVVYAVTDHVKVTGGLRYSRGGKDADQTRAKVGTLPASYLATPLTGRIRERFFDPSAQVQYVFTPGTMVYFSYAKGSKSGGFAAAQPTTTATQFAFRPERSRSLEVGAKLELFDRRARLNVALFDTRYRDLQVSNFNAASSSFVTGNAASASSRGAEAEFAARIAGPLRIQGSLGYLKAKYVDFPGAQCLAGAPAVPPGTTCTQNIGGTSLPRAPHFTAAGAADLDQPIGDALRLVGRAGIQYRAGVNISDIKDPRLYQAGYAKLDLQIGLAGNDHRWELMLVGKNLTNRLTADTAIATPTAAAGTFTFIEQPGRILAVSGRVGF